MRTRDPVAGYAPAPPAQPGYQGHPYPPAYPAAPAPSGYARAPHPVPQHAPQHAPQPQGYAQPYPAAQPVVHPPARPMAAYPPQGMPPVEPPYAGPGAGSSMPPSGPRQNRAVKAVNVIGALLSVALVAGVGIWSYRLMVRDVTGVPVIRALAGPIRSSPDDPGGRQANYQGLAVNAVAAQSDSDGSAENIALAPPPASLAEEDRAGEEMTARRASSGASAPITAPDAVGAAVAAAMSDAAPATVQTAAAQPAPLDLVPASVPGVSRSPMPRARNAQAVAQAASRPAQPVAPAAPTQVASNTDGSGDQQAEALLQELVTRLSAPDVTDIDPDSLTPGTRLVQLGIYQDEDSARRAWDTINQRFPAFLEDRGRVVEAATSGGRVFYRLRAAGFADEPEARRFCSMLIAENLDCIPTLIR
ncbi:SPOR domain-containing protein [Rhodobacter sp. NTK016B]|uniref:SPOR domain-containing protein n=1 Tax=Rhodobacter sp. NTK016B TaxID=2759676 RepID=UPI001A8CC204|nr:SPOR domain-containing protein [Rhodobacter sp. NTK016B]MBN8292394.1 SPOR domain-containing protein [Rhodobacter sp. NTK016B]